MYMYMCACMSAHTHEMGYWCVCVRMRLNIFSHVPYSDGMYISMYIYMYIYIYIYIYIYMYTHTPVSHFAQHSEVRSPWTPSLTKPLFLHASKHSTHGIHANLKPNIFDMCSSSQALLLKLSSTNINKHTMYTRIHKHTCVEYHIQFFFLQNAWIVFTVDGTTGQIVPANSGVKRQSLYFGPRVAPYEASGSFVSVTNFAGRLMLYVHV
jgi:hypothetical protein